GPPPAAHGPGRAAPGAGAFRPGEGGRLNSLEVLLLLLLAGAVYAAAAFGPAFIRNYQLANAFDDEARRAHLLGDDEIRANVLRKARAIGFEDWDADDIVVERDADQRRIRVSADYTVEVELLGGRYVWPLRFHPVVDRPIERR
ncbi:MAG TPA: hypothetical protein VNM66_03300, partial [Thermodesulfobacteriota bacterium]|nr:hypothetical protein [Thermodesulfobacteriota bacterium]